MMNDSRKKTDDQIVVVRDGHILTCTVDSLTQWHYFFLPIPNTIPNNKLVSYLTIKRKNQGLQSKNIFLFVVETRTSRASKNSALSDANLCSNLSSIDWCRFCMVSNSEKN